LGRGGSGASSGGTHGQTGDEAIGIIAEQLLPPGSRDERLSRAWATSTLGAAPRGTAGGGAQASGSGTSSSSCLRVGVGEDDRKFGWEQSDELLPDAQERGLLQPKRIGHDLRQAAEQRRQRLKTPEKINQVLQSDFTDYVSEDGEKHRIGCVTEYLSRFNLISEVSETETALDLIAVVEGALKEIVDLEHELAGEIILVTDNGPAMKARRFRNFVKKTELLIHVRSRKYHPQTIGREERFHGSLKLEHLYRVLPRNRTELIEAVKAYRQFYNHERLHMSLGYRTPAAVYLNKDSH
jgi:transposase InsO family protein